MSTQGNTPTGDRSAVTGHGADGARGQDDPTEQAKGAASRVADTASDSARKVAESRYSQGRDMAAGQIDTASEALDGMAESLEQQGSPFASYASDLSDQLSSFSSKVSTSSLDEMVSGARSLARNNPAAFMLGSVAIGLAASRFFKASGEEVAQRYSSGNEGGSSSPGSASGTSGLSTERSGGAAGSSGVVSSGSASLGSGGSGSSAGSSSTASSATSPAGAGGSSTTRTGMQPGGDTSSRNAQSVATPATGRTTDQERNR